MVHRGALFFLVFLLAAGTWQSQNRTSQGLMADPSNASRADVNNALAEICEPNKIIREPGGNAAGCRGCPKGSGFQDEREMQWDLKRAFAGHFTSASEDNIILSSRGCEPHSMNCGGSFVFVLDQGRLKFLKYDQSLITERCHKLRFADGRDFMICQDQWGAQGSVSYFVYLVAFNQSGESKITRLFETRDWTFTCGEDVDGSPSGPVQQSEIKSVEFHERTGGELSGLSLKVTRGKKQLTQAEKEACEQSLKKSNYEKTSLSVTTTEYRIHFSFDSREFKVASASKAILKLFPEPQFPE